MLEYFVGTRQISNFTSTLAELGARLTMEYGSGLTASGYEAARVSSDPTVEHFFSRYDEQALDFIEMLFRRKCHPLPAFAVDEINKIFREDGIGYELTPLIVQKATSKKEADKITHPQIVRKADQYSHEQVIEPSLEILRNPIFAVANTEMLRAHEEYRKGQFDDAITDCGAAFESALKTICHAKGWVYDKDRDTTAKLVSICRENSLFDGFYAPIFEATGTIRNRLGDAHGRGPAKQYSFDQRQVEHLLQMTAAHIIFLAKLANVQ
jgi:hypothetical protein